MPAFYEQILWIPEKFCFTNLDLHHGLLVLLCYKLDSSSNKPRSGARSPC
jgi:hypothetical protein